MKKQLLIYDKIIYMKAISAKPMPIDHADMSYMLPTFNLTEKDLPEIKEWKVGKKYKLEIEVEQIAVSKNEYGKSPMTARFRIHKVGEKELLSDEEKAGRKGY